MATTPASAVSTVIPAYNAAGFIERALRSALEQGIPHHEIIVVDDGSKDDTSAIVARFAGDGVRLIRHEKPSGAAAARNAGVDAATGEYVAFLDSDDEWLPGKLSRQLAILETNPEMTFAACRADLIGEDGINQGDIYRGAPPAVGREAWRALLAYPSVATPTVVARRSAILRAGKFNRWLPVAEDQDLWIRLALMGETGYVPETLVRVYSTPNSLSKTDVRAQVEILLPMIETYVHRNLPRLTRAQIAEILGERLSRSGRLAYAAGNTFFGMRMILKAIAYGNRPFDNLLYLARASTVVRWLKRRFAAPRSPEAIGVRP